MNTILTPKNLCVALLLLFSKPVFAQVSPSDWPVKETSFLQGFEVKVSGEVLDFLPGLTNGQVALLTRANKEAQSAEFQSAVIPTDYNKSYVSLVWSAAIAQRLQQQAGNFTLYINNTPFFNFTTHRDSTTTNWTIKSGEANLSFVATEITKGTQDAVGYMFLNIPTASITKGERISIKVVGADQSSMDWYMPFGIPVKNSQHVLAEPALVKTKDGLKQRIRVEVHHAGNASIIEFKIGGKIVRTANLKPGKRVFYLLHEPVTSSTPIALSVTIAKKLTTEYTLTLKPVRKFEVYFLAHSHVDIGFTHTQDDVEKLQWRNFEKGIELAERTQHYPEGSQFKWNAEITWAIEGYLKNASAEKRKKFIEAVQKGWIGLDAMYGSQLTGLQREEEMINNQRFAGQLADQYGFEVKTAMISDVPGYSWGSVESLAQSGIQYFSSGPNHMPHLPHGGYQVGHTLETWGDVPFYWTSASGKQKILFWMTSHGYSWFHNWSVDILSKAGGDPVVKFLDELEQQKYPYDIVQLRYTVGNDNGPPDETMPEFIKQWNETYAWPKMRIATTKEMMVDFEKRYSDVIPTYSGDFTPYWEDGAASSALETGINRKTADELVQAETLHAMLKLPNNLSAFDAAWRNVALYSEHTWGAAVSKSQPDSEFTKNLWNVKQGFALNAAKQAHTLRDTALQILSSKTKTIEAIQVINTTSWNRTNLVTLPADWNLLGSKITDDSDKPVETQRLSNGDLVFVAQNVPALGSKKFLIRKGMPKTITTDHTLHTLSTEQINVTLNPETGNFSSLTWNDGANLIDAGDTIGFNAYWYGGVAKENLSTQFDPAFEMIEHGPVLTKICISTHAAGAELVIREVQVVNGLEQVSLTNVVDKKQNIENENVRFSFPFNIPNGQVRIDIPWATVRPETDQLKGANKNFYSVQRWVDISNDQTGITLATLEAPLLEIGDMHGQHWMTDMTLRPWIKTYQPSTRLFSWVMNNVWFVNYKASQEGKIPFHYVLKPHAAFDEAAAKKFGIEQTQPLMVIPTDKQTKAIEPLLTLQGNSTILITSLKQSRDGKALMIRFFNTSNQSANAELTWNGVNVKNRYNSSPRENKGETLPDNSISLTPWEVRTIRVEL